MNSQKKWDEMESDYLMSEGENNINSSLLKIVRNSNNENKEQNEKIITSITKYFKSMAKRYYPAIFFEVSPSISIWN